MRKKYIYIISFILVAAGAWLYVARFKTKPASFEVSTVQRRNLTQSVEVTGEIKPAARIALAFKNSGTVKDIRTHVGDKVNAGDVLMRLKDDDVSFAAQAAEAALSMARANLESKLAGEIVESIQLTQAQVDQAQAVLYKVTVDLASIKRTTADNVKNAVVTLLTAKHNLANQQAIVKQQLQNAYDSAQASLLTALGPLSTSLVDGDQITGVDNTAANQAFIGVLGLLDSGSLERAKALYRVAKDAKRSAESGVNSLSVGFSKDEFQVASTKLQVAILAVQTYLTELQKVLAASLTNASFTLADLAAKKLVVDTDRTNVSTQNTVVLNAVQTIKNADLTKTQTVAQLEDAYQATVAALDAAKTHMETQVALAQEALKVQTAALEAAKAALELKRAKPRNVDLAGLRAAVQQAQVNVEKARRDVQNIQLLAPVAGTISEIIPGIGEQVTANMAAVHMLGEQQYDIQAAVPEADIAKLSAGQKVTLTLDTYGDEVKFTGTVTSIEPDRTKIQDAVYYKIRVQMEPAGRVVKPGMTANVIIHSADRENVLVLPLRAVRTKNGTREKFVRVLSQAQEQERFVTLGLKGDEGRVEITAGLSEGEVIIIGDGS